MEIIRNVNGDYVTDLNGNLFRNPPLPSIDLEIDGNQFPPVGSTGYFRITSAGVNTLYIDFGDGSEVYEYPLISGLNQVDNSPPLHIYENAVNRIVKLWFEFPQRITRFTMTRLRLVGTFPSQLGLYKLMTLGASNTNFDNFPHNFLGGDFNVVILNNAVQNEIDFIPEWILNSKIVELFLSTNFDLSDPLTSNLDRLIEIQGLQVFDIGGANINNSALPSNLKDISTLRILGLGNNPITHIDEKINDCKQLTRLSIGYRGGKWTSDGSPLFTSWGIGIANMPNLLQFEWSHSINAPTTLPTGIETAPNCKNLYARNLYRTQSRMDEFVENAYDKVVLEASMALGNTLLRQVSLHLGYAGAIPSVAVRPSGTYQAPTGFVLGSNNGTPASPMEMIYVLTKQYRWTITVLNEAGNANQEYNYLS